jgi:glycosyltransferase involved in cell wall biosynthesis
MNILFVHDHVFKRDGSEYYSSGGLPAAVWSRYLSVFENLTVVGRDGGALLSDDLGFTLSSCDGVRFELLPNISNLKSLILGNNFVAEECRRLVAKADGVIARLPSRLGQVFIAEAIRQKKPYAVEVVACPWDALWNYGSWKGKLLAPFAMLNLKRRLHSAPFALYVTKEFLQRRYPTKGISTFCSNVEISEVSENVLSDRMLRIDSREKITFGLIGNYSSRYKGIDVTIKALASIRNCIPEWEFQVLGSGNPDYYLQLAQELGVADKVHFVGSKPSGQDVYDWLDSIDIYLQPSYQEGLPRALIEAMSRGLPALATTVAGIPELLEAGELVPAGDAGMLSRKIMNLANDKALCIALSEKNFNAAKQYYKTILDTRRGSFLLAFKSSIETNI